MPPVPHRDVESHTGEQTTLSDTERRSSSHEARVVLDQTCASCELISIFRSTDILTHQCRADTPADHDKRDPQRRTSALHHHVGRDFSQDVEGEEDGQSNLIIVSTFIANHKSCSTHVVIQTLHVETLLESSKTSIADVGTVEER